MRALKICLWIAGILCLISVAGVFLPLSTWQSIANFFGLEETISDSPLVNYSVRLMCATYAGVGVFFIILARRPGDYGIMVPFSGLAAVVLGVVCAITGLTVAMPVLWFLGDSIPCIVLGVLIMVFWRQTKQTSL